VRADTKDGRALVLQQDWVVLHEPFQVLHRGVKQLLVALKALWSGIVTILR